MLRVLLDISDGTTRLTLAAMLEKENHLLVDADADVVISDDAKRAVAHSEFRPALLLARMGEIPRAVQAMRKGVFGYIFIPLQPGEAVVMVERAAAAAGIRPAVPAPEGTIGDAESSLILATLRRCKYNKTRTARILGIGRNTLWRKLKKIENAGGPLL